MVSPYLVLSGRGLKQEYLDSGHKSKWVLLTKLNANSAVFLRFILDVIVTLLKPLQMKVKILEIKGGIYRSLKLMIIQPLFPSPNRVQLYRVVLMHWHPVRQWNTRATQNRILNESTKSIVFRKSLVRFALLLDWNICTRDIGNTLLLPGYCNIRDCWDLLQHFAGFLLSQPPGPARMLAVATPEKIKGNKSPLRYKYYQILQVMNIRIFSYNLKNAKYKVHVTTKLKTELEPSTNLYLWTYLSSSLSWHGSTSPWSIVGTITCSSGPNTMKWKGHSLNNKVIILNCLGQL